MTKSFKALIAGKTAAAVAVAALAGASALPTAASAQVGRNIVNCDAPGGRQQVGALIGAVVGGVVGNEVAKNERSLGTAAGIGLGAAAGSWIGCKQQRDRQVVFHDGYNTGYAQAASNTGYGQAAYNTYVARSNLRVRAAPTMASAQVGSLRQGQAFEALGNYNGWVQVGQHGRPVGYVSAAYVSPTRY